MRARGPSATRERRADDAGAAVLKTVVLCGEPYGRAESVKPVKGQKGRCWAWGNREATAHLAVVEFGCVEGQSACSVESRAVEA